MKYIFTWFLLLCFATGAFCHHVRPADSVDICGHKLEIPSELKLTKPQTLSGTGYSLTWQYISAKQLDKMPEKTTMSLSKNLKNASLIYLYAYFLYQPCKAYGFVYDAENGTRAGRMVVFGNVNNRPVFMQIDLNSTTFENEQLPIFINRLLLLGK